MKSSLYLYLPALLAKPSHLTSPQASVQAQETCPALSTLLSRASCLEAPTSMEQNLKALFQGLGDKAIPTGALGALYHDLPPLTQGQWCRADLVNCWADQHTAYILGQGDWQQTSLQANSFVKQLNAHLQQDEIHLKITSTGEGYAHIPHYHEIILNDLWESMGKSLHNCLPSGPDQIYWRRLMTECQMLLARSAVNTLAQQQQSLISSVWFWGIGHLPESIKTQFDSIYTSHSVLGGLAKRAQKRLAHLPEKFDKALFNVEGLQKIKNVLVGELQFFNLFKHQRFEQHQTLLCEYEENWFKPLLDAIKQDDLPTLLINVGDGRLFKVTKQHLNYFWRRIKPLETFLKT